MLGPYFIARGSIVVALVAAPLVAGPSALAKHGGDFNPCRDQQTITQLRLKCPDLRMRAPFDISQDRVGGRRVLRSGNSIDSVGVGPAELRGRRISSRTMTAWQRVVKRGGGREVFRTRARLKFKRIPGQGGYWKWRNAARFELWRLDGQGRRTKLVARGRKQVYCLRDLQHTNPGLKGSPSSAVYPACSQDRGRRRVTLGTSVGWSDVYPASYHEQYIDTSRVRRKGCYAYVHIADPNNRMHELRERNNEASTVVRLGRSGSFRGFCNRRDRGVSAAQQGDGTAPAGVDPSEDPDEVYPY